MRSEIRRVRRGNRGVRAQKVRILGADRLRPVADEAPIDLRATSFGVFNFVSGIALLLASLIAGALWEMVGPYATFMAGAAFTAIGLVGTAVALRR